MFTVPVEESVAMALKNCWNGLLLTLAMGDQVCPPSVELVTTTSVFGQVPLSALESLSSLTSHRS
jgi:hypothetical protein